MIRIVVGGAIDKQKVADNIIKIGGDKVNVKIMSDIQAAMEVMSGNADYYFGACTTGGGGALAMAIALIGRDKCATVSMPGTPPDEKLVMDAVKKGKIAFGFTNDHIEKAVAMILNLIIK
jgi:hypothetical protein